MKDKSISCSKNKLSSTTVSTLIINQHFRMTSEGSRATEDWSNDAENSALITGINCILKYIKQETNIRNFNNISQYCWVFFCILIK